MRILNLGTVFDDHELFSRNMSESEGRDYVVYYKYRAPSMDGIVGRVIMNISAVSEKENHIDCAIFE